MILRALYDYYHRCEGLPAPGLEEKEIGFLIVITPEGRFVQFEDCRSEKNSARTFLVRKQVGRSSSPVANYLYDNCAYVLGFCNPDKAKNESARQKEADKTRKYYDVFIRKVQEISSLFPDNAAITAVRRFYEQGRESILEQAMRDPLWDDIVRNLSKKYSTFSFRIQGDTKIVAEKRELLQLEAAEDDGGGVQNLCLITGERGVSVETTTATMIPGSQATAKLVSFQVNSGYDSYGKSKCYNAPISREAEFAYTTALKALLGKASRNKFLLGTRTFLFWASGSSQAAQEAELSLFSLLGFHDEKKDDPNAHVKKVRDVFQAIYSGQLRTTLDDRFYILGLAPNSARIAVVYWAETILRDFAGRIMNHFNDMELADNRPDKKPYQGIREMLSAVTLGGKVSDATPNLPEAVARSIFQGLPYPFTLFSSCIRRIRAEQSPYLARVAILKAYLNRLNDENKKLYIMLDRENNNIGYLCGRLFAVLEKIQEDASHINSIRERYMNAASATPSAVFPTVLNLSVHHSEKLNEGSKIFHERLKQEIIGKLPADGFPPHLDLQDQGRFFVGYYHQRQDFFTKKSETNEQSMDNN